MKLFIWEGDGVSSAYHDDGTLVVLAETPEQAREIARKDRPEPQWGYYCDRKTERGRLCNFVIGATLDHDHGKQCYGQVPHAHVDSCHYFPTGPSGWDGAPGSIDRPPDRVVELTEPAVVAFNGGGV